LSVSDTGTGMTAEVLAHVFEPFFTTKEVGKGTGLGLATAYGIVKQHAGDISVYSEPGQGSTFRIYLPLSDEAPADVERPAVAGVVHRGHETVMVAEDSPLVRNLTCNMLRAHGYRVFTAASGDECLSELATLEEPIDLLVVDVIMPGMNGRELYRRVAATRPGVKVLFMSGYSEEVIATQGILEGGLDFIAKPFAIESLARKVREVLDRQTAPAAGASLGTDAIVGGEGPESPAS
jgi:two-component system cell cycle sensor histidine kinase/response regulator CckA